MAVALAFGPVIFYFVQKTTAVYPSLPRCVYLCVVIPSVVNAAIIDIVVADIISAVE